MKKPHDTVQLLKMLGFSLGALGLIVLVCNCAPKAVVVAPIAPAVVRVRAQVMAAAVSSARLERSVGMLHTGVSAMGVEIERTLQAADVLRVRGSATAAELDDQWQSLAGMQTRNLFLEAEAQSATWNATEQKVLRETAVSGLAELETAAVAADKGVETLKTQIVQQGDNAALGKAVKAIGWGIAAIAAIAAAAWGISKFKLL